MRKLFFIYGWLICLPLAITAQQKIILNDISAVVGSEIILRSDIMNEVSQLVSQGMAENDEKTTCEVLEDFMFQKVMLNQAYLDSIEVTDEEIESELERRIAIFAAQAGGVPALEKMTGKPLEEIKNQYRSSVKQQILVERVKGKITASVKVTPAEIVDFYNSIPKDSLPYIQGEMQVAQIVVYPIIREEENERIIAELNELKEKIAKGRPFGLLAKLNSDDLGSKYNDGSIGLVRREDLDPDFAAVAFSLVEGQVSDVVKSQFGYHIIKLIAKKGEYAEIQHILKVPQVWEEDLEATKIALEKIKGNIETLDTLDFERAAALYSEDKDTKNGGGYLINMKNGSNWFSSAELDPFIYESVLDLETGQITEPISWVAPGQKTSVSLYMMVNKKDAHVADLEMDYQKIMEFALLKKQTDVIIDWINKKQGNMYIRLNPEFENCTFRVVWKETTGITLD